MWMWAGKVVHEMYGTWVLNKRGVIFGSAEFYCRWNPARKWKTAELSFFWTIRHCSVLSVCALLWFPIEDQKLCWEHEWPSHYPVSKQTVFISPSFQKALDDLSWPSAEQIGWVPCLFPLSTSSVLIDDGTPRIPFPLRMHLSLTVYRLKQMIEAQEGFTVSEQEVFFQGRTVNLSHSCIF